MPVSFIRLLLPIAFTLSTLMGAVQRIVRSIGEAFRLIPNPVTSVFKYGSQGLGLRTKVLSRALVDQCERSLLTYSQANPHEVTVLTENVYKSQMQLPF